MMKFYPPPEESTIPDRSFTFDGKIAWVTNDGRINIVHYYFKGEPPELLPAPVWTACKIWSKSGLKIPLWEYLNGVFS